MAALVAADGAATLLLDDTASTLDPASEAVVLAGIRRGARCFRPSPSPPWVAERVSAHLPADLMSSPTN